LPAGEQGNYTLFLAAAGGTDATIPHAPGYGTMTVSSSGGVKLSGTLADGTAFHTSAQLHVDGKSWTLYGLLYPGKRPGSLAAEMTFENLVASDCDGLASWVKPAQLKGADYRNGFSLDAGLFAAKYAPPPPASGTLTLSGGNLTGAIIDDLSITSKGKVTVMGTNDGDVSMAVVASTGAFKGTFLFPGTSKKNPFGGVIYQKPSATGLGSFLEGGQAGVLQITP
jgi:hypothetical protein